jgi:hypothetical protein
MEVPSALSLLIFKRPSTTPNQKVGERPMRHTSSPGSASPTTTAVSARRRSAGVSV